MTRPVWARRDRRPLIIALSAAIPAAVAIGFFVLMIVLAARGVL